MNRHAPHTTQLIPHATLLALALLLASSTPTKCRAQHPLQGNAELLLTVAKQYRANLDRLQTWQGHVQSSHRSTDGNEQILVESQIDFAYDRKNSASRYRLQPTKNVIRHGTVEKDRGPLVVIAELHKDGAFYRLQHDLPHQAPSQTVVIQSRAFKPPALHDGMFWPSYFFTNRGADIDRICQMYFDNAQEADFDGSVTRTGDLVTLTRNESNPARKMLFVFNLAQGGNPTRIETTSTRNGAPLTTTLTWTWTHLAGVWVPQKITQHIRQSSQGVTLEERTELTWSKSTANDPIDEGEFSLAKLALLPRRPSRRQTHPHQPHQLPTQRQTTPPPPNRNNAMK
jgi:hypothetical protein